MKITVSGKMLPENISKPGYFKNFREESLQFLGEIPPETRLKVTLRGKSMAVKHFCKCFILYVTTV